VSVLHCAFEVLITKSALKCYITKLSRVRFRPKKFVRISRDDYFNSEDHHLSTTPARAEKACAYDLDDTDIAWLEVFNGERAQVKHPIYIVNKE